jgi:hypothetical protein
MPSRNATKILILVLFTELVVLVVTKITGFW